ncbi:MAG TPA: hypothetical protein VMH40_00960 [Myxococcaceae bacterium]|nr:hypothetical protein [Myxococcaceae bacterium]
MRKDSPVVACSIAALILLVAGAAVVPAPAWRAMSVLAHVAPTMIATVGGHASSAVQAAGLGALAAPALLRDPAPREPPAPQVRVCRRELPKNCSRQAECPRQQVLQRLRAIFPIDG